jgi:hypothetical protein
VTIKGTNKTITFSVDSKDGHLVIRQEAEGKKLRTCVQSHWPTRRN